MSSYKSHLNRRIYFSKEQCSDNTVEENLASNIQITIICGVFQTNEKKIVNCLRLIRFLRKMIDHIVKSDLSNRIG